MGGGITRARFSVASIIPLEGLGVFLSVLVRSIFQTVSVTVSDDWSGSSGRPAKLLGMVL